MTGGEAVVLGFILAAFVVFGATLAWVSYEERPRVRSIGRQGHGKHAAAMIGTSRTASQPRRS